MGTNLSGFPVKDSCLLLGTPGEGPVSKSLSTRVAAVESAQSRLRLSIRRTYHRQECPSFFIWSSQRWETRLQAVGGEFGRGPRP